MLDDRVYDAVIRRESIRTSYPGTTTDEDPHELLALLAKVGFFATPEQKIS
ncbi:hypothetical protein KAR02_11790 [Candidatus Bipolaricaulota bacterium]|nr:hypothetical protein [Candidatus Bipolaricaulota bacterium]